MLEQSLADGLPLATEEVARDPVFSDEKLVRVILAARQIAQVYYSIYVGSQHIIPPIEGEDLRALYQVAQRWFEKESE